MTDAQGARQMKQRHHRGIALPALQAADILLRHAGHFGKTLLREAFFPSQPAKVSAHKPAHVHLRQGAGYIL